MWISCTRNYANSRLKLSDIIPNSQYVANSVMKLISCICTLHLMQSAISWRPNCILHFAHAICRLRLMQFAENQMQIKISVISICSLHFALCTCYFFASFQFACAIFLRRSNCTCNRTCRCKIIASVQIAHATFSKVLLQNVAPSKKSSS